MNALISAALALLGQLGPSLAPSGLIAMLAQVVPSLTSSASIGAAIKLVSALLPPAVQLATDEIPVIKGIIASLRGNGATTAEQMDALDALNNQCDARFDAALAAAEAADKVAAQS